MRNEVIKDFINKCRRFGMLFSNNFHWRIKNACASKIHSVIVFSESNCQFENIFGSITWDYRYFRYFVVFKQMPNLHTDLYGIHTQTHIRL